jgi:excisionase family DNA binding protein
MSVASTIRPATGAAAPVLSLAPSPAAAPERLAAELIRLLGKPRAPRLALELTEAAAALGVSKAFLDEHVRHELRLVRRGRKVLVPVRELERWLEESAAFTLAGQR